MSVTCHQSTLASTCGVHLFHSFQSEYWGEHINNVRLGGAKLAVAGFIDTEHCRQVYKELKRRFKIVYQSSVRRNTNSGSQFFFVVYDGKRK